MKTAGRQDYENVKKSKDMNRQKVARRLLKMAKELIGANSEKEVERLLKVVLPKSPFRNKTHAVGGYVRDEFLGLEAKDLDIVVEMRDGGKKLTHWLHNMFSKQTGTPFQKGAGYPIWQLVFKGNVILDGELYETKGAEIEVADTMKESFPDESSRQRKTDFGTLSEDMERRDFTVNMLIKDLTTGKVKDPTGMSMEHLEEGVLDHINAAKLERSLRDDPLRMIRLIRFQAKYGWKVPMNVLRIVKKNSARIKIVSSERIMGELMKVMKIGKLHKAIRLMKIVGLLKYILPEVEALQGVKQRDVRKIHQEGDVFRHTLLVLKNAPPTIAGQLAALLHDVGKPQTQEFIGEKIQFLGHQYVSAEMAEAILRRLKFDSKTVKRVKMIVKNHMSPHGLSGTSKERTLRKFIRKIGDEMVDAVLDMAEADALGNLPPKNYIPKLRERIEEIRHRLPVTNKPILNGNEIAKVLGITPGPIIGKVVRFLLEMQDEYASKRRALTKSEAARLVVKEFKK